MPTDMCQRGDELHHLLLNEPENVIVTAQLAELFYPLLVNKLAAEYHWLGDHNLVHEIANDTLLKYLHHPAKFDATKRGLLGYLLMDARGDLLNRLQKEKKVVALHLDEAEDRVEELIGADDPERRLIASEPSPVIAQVWSKLSERDRHLVVLMMDGVRETEAYARLLGIEHLARQEQSAIVKRHKDRMKKFIERELRKQHRGWLKDALRYWTKWQEKEKGETWVKKTSAS